MNKSILKKALLVCAVGALGFQVYKYAKFFLALNSEKTDDSDQDSEDNTDTHSDLDDMFPGEDFIKVKVTKVPLDGDSDD
jgi:hypothetical protein